MAKTIKFNLICDNKPIRTIEDLQENFSIEDVLGYYNSKLLHRWLKVRGYVNELEKVNAIQSNNDVNVVKELIRIFDIVSDKKDIEECIYTLDYTNKQKKLYELCEAKRYKTNEVISAYKAGYERLVNEILENPNDMAIIKAAIKTLTANYEWIIDLDYFHLFYKLKDESITAIMCMLMNDTFRKYFLEGRIKGEICKIIKSEDFKEKMGENLLCFSGVTDGYWKDLEPKGKKYMIIMMYKNCSGSNYVRSAGVTGGDLSEKDIKDNFVILDGVDYKSNSNYDEILYMEV